MRANFVTARPDTASWQWKLYQESIESLSRSNTAVVDGGYFNQRKADEIRPEKHKFPQNLSFCIVSVRFWRQPERLRGFDWPVKQRSICNEADTEFCLQTQVEEFAGKSWEGEQHFQGRTAGDHQTGHLCRPEGIQGGRRKVSDVN